MIGRIILCWKRIETYCCVVDEEVDVEAEGDGDGYKTDKLVQLYFTSLLPGQLFDFDPLGHL